MVFIREGRLLETGHFYFFLGFRGAFIRDWAFIGAFIPNIKDTIKERHYLFATLVMI